MKVLYAMSRKDPYQNLIEYFADAEYSDDSDGSVSVTSQLSLFGWEDYWADDVRAMYNTVQTFALESEFRLECSYSEFFEFCYNHSTHIRPKLQHT